MSLRVWLPLNGTLENKGLDNVTVTNNGAVVDNNGKIGKCYSFDGSDDYISLNGSCLYNIIKGDSQPFSIGFWIYQADSTRAIIFGDYSLAGGIGFNIELTTGHVVRFYWNGSPDLSIGQLNVGVTTWNHVVLVYDTTHLYGYLNGNLVYTYTGTLTAKNKTSGSYYLGRDYRTGSTALNGKLNDFRLYDHALSPLEVKQISQGLILHYPLNRNGWGNENYMPNSKKMQLGNSNTNTGTWRLAGANNMDRSRVLISDSPIGECYGFQNTGIQTVNDGSCYGIDSFPLEANTIYTFSMWARIVSGNGGYAGYNVYNLTSENGGSHNGTIIKNYRVTLLPDNGNWVRCWYTFTTNNSTTRNIYIGITTNNESVTTQMCGIKIEKGSIATPWCPNSADELYNILGLNDNIQYDTSGYGNNGTKTGTFNYDSDSPKYNVSTYFEDYTRYISCNLKGQIPDKITMSCWVKTSNTNPRGGYHILFNIHSTDFEISISGSGGKVRLGYVIGGSRKVKDVGPNILDGNWHMVTSTYDGIAIKRYVDGILVDTENATGALSTLTIVGIGAFPGATTYGNTQVYESDVRIYCTALSAEDVKSLYHNSAYIDNQGNLYGSILREV